MKNKPLTVKLYMGGKQIETMTEEQRQRLADRLSEVMSLSYTVDYEEFLKIKK